MEEPTATIPLTTIFTPPPECSSHWTYEPAYYNSIDGGLLMQNVLEDRLDETCFPPEFEGYGRVFVGQIFSPGACPHGYTTPVMLRSGGPVTTAVCCPEGFSYTTEYTTFIGGPSTSTLFAGCGSSYPESKPPTTVLAREKNTDLASSRVKGGIPMWAQAITVAFESSDLTLFTTDDATGPSKTSSPSTKTGVTVITVRPTTNPTETNPNSSVDSSPSGALSTDTSSNNESPQKNELSTGAKIGIVVGVTIPSILLIGLILFFLRRRRRRKQEQVPATYYPPKQYNFEPRPTEPGELSGHSESDIRILNRHEMRVEPERSELAS